MPTSPTLVLVNIAPEEWAFPLKSDRQVIGRGGDSNILIPSEYRSVSRRHAEVWTDHKGPWIQDLNSRTGTRLNGVDLFQMVPTRLKPFDRIWMGGLELRLLPELPPRGTFDAESASGRETAPPCEDMSTIRPDSMAPSLDTAGLLSRSEHEVLLFMARGFLLDDEIAKELHRSPNTIRTHVSNIVKKLGLRSRHDILFWLQGKNKGNLHKH